MSGKTLTKKQIQEATALELVLRMDYLHALSKRRPIDAGVPLADIREAVAIDEELKNRLCKVLAGFRGEMDAGKPPTGAKKATRTHVSAEREPSKASGSGNAQGSAKKPVAEEGVKNGRESNSG